MSTLITKPNQDTMVIYYPKHHVKAQKDTSWTLGLAELSIVGLVKTSPVSSSWRWFVLKYSFTQIVNFDACPR